MNPRTPSESTRTSFVAVAHSYRNVGRPTAALITVGGRGFANAFPCVSTIDDGDMMVPAQGNITAARATAIAANRGAVAVAFEDEDGVQMYATHAMPTCTMLIPKGPMHPFPIERRQSLAFDCMGVHLATAFQNGTVAVWRVGQSLDLQPLVSTLPKFDKGSVVTAVTWKADDENVFVTACDNGTLEGFDTRTACNVATLTFPQLNHKSGNPPLCVATCPVDHTNTVVAGYTNGQHAQWDTRKFDTPTIVVAHEKKKSKVMCASFTPCAKGVVTGADDGTLAVWSASSGERLVTLGGHTHAVVGMEFNPVHSGILVTCSEDGTVAQWTVPSPLEAAAIAAAQATTPTSPKDAVRWK